MLDNGINYWGLRLSMNEELFCALGFSPRGAKQLFVVSEWA